MSIVEKMFNVIQKFRSLGVYIEYIYHKWKVLCLESSGI